MTTSACRACAIQPASARGVREVGVLLAHHDQGGCDVGQPCLRQRVARARGAGERAGVSRPPDARRDLLAVLGEVGGPPACVQLREVRLPGDGRPQRCDGGAQEQPLHRADRAVANERADEDQAGNRLRPLGSNEHRDAGAHGVTDDDSRAAKRLDQRDDITGGFLVAVGRERGVAVAVAAQISTGDPVAGVPQCGSEEAVSRPGKSPMPGTSITRGPLPVTS